MKNFPHQVDLSDQEERLVKKGEGVSAGFEVSFVKVGAAGFYVFKFMLLVLDHDKVSQQVFECSCFLRVKDLILNKVSQQVLPSQYLLIFLLSLTNIRSKSKEQSDDETRRLV